jgi:serine/threonine protein kinase
MPTLGRYEIERLIASGGMAEVHLGHDKTLLRKVALKLPHPHLWQESRARERFLQEGRIIAALSHENIVHIYDVGEFEGRLYLAMEYVAGESLDQAIQRMGPLPPLTVLALVLQILRGLQAAHAQGILHRDIKPANLLLTPQGQLKMADFGLSRLLGGESLSLSGQFIGTPRYTAPEVAAGGNHLPQSDVFAVGMVALELWVGRPVVALENPQASLRAICEGRFPSVAESAPSLPPLLKESLQKLLALDPGQRPDAATALASLESYAWDHRLKCDAARIERAWSDPLAQGRREAEELIPLWRIEIQALEKQGHLATARKQTLALERWSNRKTGAETDSSPMNSASDSTIGSKRDSQPIARTSSSGFLTSAWSRMALGLGVLALVIGISVQGWQQAKPIPNSPATLPAPHTESVMQKSEEAGILSPAVQASNLDTTASRIPTAVTGNASLSSTGLKQDSPKPKTPTSRAVKPHLALPSENHPVPAQLPGLLRILTKPGYASAWIDGQEKGMTPTAWLSLSPGRHQILLTRSGCLPDTSEVILAAAESLEIRRELRRVVENRP